MICPRCKNEKFAEDVCPKCGSNQKEALLALADSLRRENKTRAAIDNYDKYLLLDPDSKEVFQKKAIAHYAEAIAQNDISLFQKTNEILARSLEDDWDWEEGHQYRVELFSRFGKLTDILEEYQQIALRDNLKREVCQKIIKIIQLIDRFKNEKEPVSTTLAKEDELSVLWKCFWPSLLGGLIVWVVVAFPSLVVFGDNDNNYGIYSLRVALGISLLSLLVLNILSYRKEKKSEKRGEKQ